MKFITTSVHKFPPCALFASKLVVGLLLGTNLTPVTALAQDVNKAATASPQGDGHGQGQLGEIVVTAQKRSQSIQKTPIAITAISGDSLRNSETSTVAGLKQSVPTLQMGEFFGVPSISLRGVQLNALNFGVESPIAFHTDGIYYARPASALSGFYDVDRVEVLRGAQGTLYGRNATGGSINIITADPTDRLSGYSNFTYGTYNHYDVEGAVSGPLSDNVSVRLATRIDAHDGYGINEATGHDIDNANEHAFRAKVKITPTSNLTILLSGDYSQSNSNPGIHLQGRVVDDGPLPGTVPDYFGTTIVPGFAARKLADVSEAQDPTSDLKFWGVSSTITLKLGDITLRSLTAYRHSISRETGSTDNVSIDLAAPALIADNAQQESQELQILGDTHNAHWIAGGYFFHEQDVGTESVAFSTLLFPLFGLPLPAGGPYLVQASYDGTENTTTAYAIFGQYTRNLTDKLSLTLGGRYSIERKTEINQYALDLTDRYNAATFGQAPPDLSVQCGAGLPTIGYAGTGVTCNPATTYHAFTPKVAVEYQAMPATLLYASYAKGFKSGAYNLGTAQNPVSPEKLDDYELGIKTTALDHKLRANLAGFFYNYKDVQVNNTLPLRTLLENAGAERTYGIEAEIAARPVDGLEFDFNGAWLHARYTQFVTLDQVRPGGDGVTFIDSAGNIVPAGTPGAAAAFNLKGFTPPQSPDYSGTFGAQYNFGADALSKKLPGNFTLRGEIAYDSKIYITQFDTSPAGEVPAHTRFNASLRYTSDDGHFFASINAKNLTDKRLVLNGYVNAAFQGAQVSGYLEPPRTVDFTAGYRF